MANRPANIHDAFFKNVLAHPETAGTFLREHLPPDVAALLSEDPPQLLPGSFVDETLGQHHSDVLRRSVRAGAGPAAALSIVVLILNYSDGGPVTVGTDLIEAALNRLVPGRTEEIMGHLTQPYYEKGEARGYEKGEAKGRQEGLVKGLQQGRIEGHVEALIRLMEKRFGALPSHLQERISAADGTAIENWFDRAIEAPDLLSVFETSHRGP